MSFKAQYNGRGYTRSILEPISCNYGFRTGRTRRELLVLLECLQEQMEAHDNTSTARLQAHLFPPNMRIDCNTIEYLHRAFECPGACGCAGHRLRESLLLTRCKNVMLCSEGTNNPTPSELLEELQIKKTLKGGWGGVTQICTQPKLGNQYEQLRS